MNLFNRAKQFLFGYDATDSPSGRRKSFASSIKTEEDVLTSQKRDKLSGATHDVRRNFAVAGFAIRKHLDYCASFSFQSRTGDKALDERIESLVDWWSRPENFDVRRQHGLTRLTRIFEESRVVDGDTFLVLRSNGTVQGVESDRVRTPSAQDIPERFRDATIIQGVVLNRDGAPIAYLISSRDAQGRMKFDRAIPAGRVLHHGFFGRFDQVRGVSPLAPVVNVLQDLYEASDYALAKMKVSQMFALATFRNDYRPAADVEENAETGDSEIKFGAGPVHLEMNPGDAVEWLESKTPPAEFQAFCAVCIQTALKALDIPYSFYAENYTNYSGSRQAILQYDLSAKYKRADVQAALSRLTRWRLGMFIDEGTLSLPGSMELRDIAFEWVPNGIPWVDPLKEVMADIAAIQSGLKSRTRCAKARGEDIAEIAAELATEIKLFESQGVPLEFPTSRLVMEGSSA